jgi:hypothetical protein
MRRYKQTLILKVYMDQNRPFQRPQIELLEQVLNQRFKDAEFEIEFAPSYFRAWSPELLTGKPREIFDLLHRQEEWVDLIKTHKQARVWVHRLNHKLPQYLRVVVKRGKGYKLIDLRKGYAR